MVKMMNMTASRIRLTTLLERGVVWLRAAIAVPPAIASTDHEPA